jgi:AraC family transcriptional regulator
VLRSLTLQLLTATALAAQKEQAPGGANGECPPWLERIRSTIEGEFHESIRIGELAHGVGLTPMQLIRAFQKHFGTSPGAYLRQVRLDHALALLAESKEPLTEVALGSGYSDQSHLCRVIKEETGLTPGEYRRSFRNE